MSNKILALNIYNNSVSALLLRNGLNGNWIEAYKHTVFEDADSATGDFSDHLNDALKVIKQELDISDSESVVSIPSDWVSYRNLRLPFKDRKKIKQVLPFELEPTLPYPIEELLVDFKPVRQGEQTDIITAAVQKEKLSKVYEVLKHHEIYPFIMTPNGLPTAICLSKFFESHEDFIFIDIDEYSCSMFAVFSGEIYLARSLQIRTSNLSMKLNRITESILQVTASFETLFNFDYMPSAVLISGNGMDISGLGASVERMLGIPTKEINVLHDVDMKIRLSDGISFLPEHMNLPSCLSLVDILGLDILNFSKERSIFKKYGEEYKNDIIKTVIAAGFAIAFGILNPVAESYHIKKEITHMNVQIAKIFQSTLPEVTRVVDPLQQMRVKVREIKDRQLYAGKTEKEILNIDILHEISKLIPDQLDIEITRFIRGMDNILISGNTDTFNAVDEMKGKLERSESFSAITINSATMDKSTNRIQFKLKIDL